MKTQRAQNETDKNMYGSFYKMFICRQKSTAKSQATASSELRAESRDCDWVLGSAKTFSRSVACVADADDDADAKRT